MKILTRQIAFLVDQELLKRVKQKAAQMKPTRKISDVMRLLAEGWVNGDFDDVTKKILK